MRQLYQPNLRDVRCKGHVLQYAFSAIGMSMPHLDANIELAPSLLMHEIWCCGTIPSRNSKTIMKSKLYLQTAWV